MQERVRLECAPHVRAAHERADRHHAAAERFRDGEDVWNDAPMVHRPQLARAAEPGLHLVGDEEHSVPVAHLAQPRPEVVARDDGAGLALDRLHDDGGDLVRVVPENGFDLVRLTEGHAVDGTDQRLDRLAELRLAHQRQRAEGLAVERGFRAHETGLAGRDARDLHRTLHRLGAGVAHEHVRDVARRDVREQPAQHRAHGIEQLLRRQRIAQQLRLDRGHHLGMADPEVVDPVAAEAVDPLASAQIANGGPVTGPLDRGEVARLGDRFPVTDEARCVVRVVVLDGALGDQVARFPLGIGACDDCDHLRGFFESEVEVFAFHK